MLSETIRYPAPTNLYPSVVLGATVALALLVAIQNLRNTETFGPSDQGRTSAGLRPAAFAAVWLSYPLVLIAVGFLISTVVAIGLSLWLLRVKHLLAYVVASLPTAALLLVGLQVLFNVAVPQGFLDLLITDFVYSL